MCKHDSQPSLPERNLGLVSRFLIGLVKAYRLVLSPWLGANCRYLPTCSSYAIEAITIHGPIKGSWLAIWRILRCNPFAEGGYNPVPKKKNSTG